MNLNWPNRRVRTRMPGGVGGNRSGVNPDRSLPDPKVGLAGDSSIALRSRVR